MSARTIISSQQIQERVAALGQEIRRDFGDDQIIALCVLKGAVFFTTDLVRTIGGEVAIDFLQVSSYGDSTTSSGVVTVLKEPQLDMHGKSVLVIEDIVDTGLTAREVHRYILNRGASKVRFATLLDKAANRKVEFTPDYVGFQIDPHFVIGYGLDHAERYRNLPDIRVID